MKTTFNWSKIDKSLLVKYVLLLILDGFWAVCCPECTQWEGENFLVSRHKPHMEVFCYGKENYRLRKASASRR